MIKTLKETDVKTNADIADSELYATSQAAIDFLERQTFLDPGNRALLELHEPPESRYPLSIVVNVFRLFQPDFRFN